MRAVEGVRFLLGREVRKTSSPWGGGSVCFFDFWLLLLLGGGGGLWDGMGPSCFRGGGGKE